MEGARCSKETQAATTPLSTYVMEFQSVFTERGKRNVYYDKQVGKVVTVLNCVLKGL